MAPPCGEGGCRNPASAIPPNTYPQPLPTRGSAPSLWQHSASLALPRPRRARAVRTVGPACAALAHGALARAVAEAAFLALVAFRLLLAEALDQHAAALAIGEQPGALRPGGGGRLRRALVAPAAIVPAQWRIVLPPRIAAARPAGRLVVAFIAAVPAALVVAVIATMPAALVITPWTIAALELASWTVAARSPLVSLTRMALV